MYQLRPYQINNSEKASEILRAKKIVYLAMEVRTGKTATSLQTANLSGANKVLFLTKKKAVESILSDHKAFNFKFELTVVNYESLHKIASNDFDIIICDEAHKLGAFPRPCKTTKILKERFGHLPFIFLSGTPTPESYSQIYHQLWISNHSPFAKWPSFYKWAKEFVNEKTKNLGFAIVKDYSDAKKDYIKEYTNPYLITFTQKEAGFESSVTENVLMVKMSNITYRIAHDLKRDKLFQGKSDLVIADTGAKMMSKLHQLYSGTLITESGKSIITDPTKGLFIKEKFKGHQIAIFYKFQAELDLLKEVFGDQLCTDLQTFNSSDKNIALQIVSGREGISLAKAKYLVYFNIDFSAVSYFQSRDRLTTRERKSNEIFYVFSQGGIEEKIYDNVLNKKNYTLSIFNKDFKLNL